MTDFTNPKEAAAYWKREAEKLEEAQIPTKLAKIALELVENYIDTCEEEKNETLVPFIALRDWLKEKV